MHISLLRHLRRNAVAYLALFVALGGTSFAAATVITGKDVKNGSLTGKDVKNSSLTGGDVKNRSLSPADFKGSVQGPKGDPGTPGPKGDTGTVDTSNFYTKAQSDARARSNAFFRDPGQHAFTVPDGVTGILAELRGGGGGGSNAVTCGSGAQGGFARVFIPTEPGQTWTVTVGAGGLSGTVPAPDGQTGGASRIANAATNLVTAFGGGGGTCAAGGTGGDVGLTDHMIGVRTERGADGTTTLEGGVVHGAGPPRFFGSGANANVSDNPGTGGYVMLHIMR